MASYNKSGLAKDDKGYYRWIGKNGDGKYVRFRLGQDRDRATIASAKLKLLWGRLETAGKKWEHATMLLAKAIARGQADVFLDGGEALDPLLYTSLLNDLSAKYGDLIRVHASRPWKHEEGQRQNDQMRQTLEKVFPSPTPRTNDHQRLHDALDDYILYLRHGETQPTGWTRVKVVQAETLKNRHKDIPLSAMTLEKMEEMLSFWARRPQVKGRDKPISAETARHQIKQLKDFWKWLHRSDKYDWKRPDGHDELRVRIVVHPEETAAKINSVQVQTFNLEELVTLYTYASPLVRSFILLGLNCGFSIAEIASLDVKDVHADTIRRIRIKSGVYGEWRLWGHTQQAIEWAMKRRQRMTTKATNLLLTDKGTSFVAPTKAGNHSARIPNLWKHLFNTIQKRHDAKMRFLPFKDLRKTSGNMIREIAGGEVAGVFLCHGTPVKTDALADIYTNRPFAKVFDGLDKMGEMLQPMFGAVAAPFPS